MIQFYGAPMSSAGRTHLMLEEAGVAYGYHKVDLRDAASKAAFREVNPGGRVPFIIDGALRLQESIAINFYLAEKYAPALWATSLEDRAQIWSWSLWAITNLQPEALRVMFQLMKPEAARDAHVIDDGKAKIGHLLHELDRALAASGFLVAGKLTVAEINVFSSVNLVVASGAATLTGKLADAFSAFRQRPAFQKLAAARG